MHSTSVWTVRACMRSAGFSHKESASLTTRNTYSVEDLWRRSLVLLLGKESVASGIASTTRSTKK